MAMHYHAIAHAVGMALDERRVDLAPVGRALRQMLADHAAPLTAPDPFASWPNVAAWPPLRRRCN